MNDDFFGYGTNSPAYDKRRHINVIFQLLMMYKLKQDPSWVVPKLKYALQLPVNEAASYVCNNILTFDEHNFMNLLRERYNLPGADFSKILSGYGCALRENKTPAGYGERENKELLVQMLHSRIYMYMQPQDPDAMDYINGVIYVWGGGMRGITMNQEMFTKYATLWHDGVTKYPTNYQLKQVEDYVINNI